MTHYGYLSSNSLQGFREVGITLETETPLGRTWQSETVYVQAYGEPAAREKVARLFKSSIMRTCTLEIGGEISSLYGSNHVEYGDGDSARIPTALYAACKRTAYNETEAEISQLTAEIRNLRDALDESEGKRAVLSDALVEASDAVERMRLGTEGYVQLSDAVYEASDATKSEITSILSRRVRETGDEA